MQFPDRVHNIREARALHGDLIDRLVPWLFESDDPADRVCEQLEGRYGAFERALRDGVTADTPSAVADLLREYRKVPAWVDPVRVERGSRLFFRAGPLGGMVLGARSLISGYASPAGNKPLALTGTLSRDGARRLAETGRYVAAVSRPGGLLAGAEGWTITLRVRLMHAHVRWLLRRDERWDRERWGEPINQHDLLATSLLFSQVFVDGIRRIGLHVTDEEAEDHLHLWRWASWVMGVRLELLPDRQENARRLARVIEITQGPPDEDSRQLVHQLLHGGEASEAPPVFRYVAAGMCQALLPDGIGLALGLPETRWRHLADALRFVLGPGEVVRRVAPRWLEDQLVALGHQYWKAANERIPRDPRTDFVPPARLRGSGAR